MLKKQKSRIFKIAKRREPDQKRGEKEAGDKTNL